MDGLLVFNHCYNSFSCIVATLFDFLKTKLLFGYIKIDDTFRLATSEL